MVLGNIYRPPRNLHENLTQFINELSTNISHLISQNSDAIFCGDYNIDLLKINDKEVIEEFFDMMCTHSCFPKITFPTRFSNKNGTLIDNVFCKISNATLNTPSGILIKTFSDHHPYVSSLKVQHNKNKSIQYRHIKIHNENMLQQVCNDLENTAIYLTF